MTYSVCACGRRVSALALVSVLSASLVLNGCAGQAQDPPLSPEQQQLRQEQNDFVITVAEGAATGALVGGLIGGLAGGRGGALLGAGLGAVAGGAAGDYIANKKQQYANAEDRVNAEIADVRSDNDKLARYLQTLQAVVNQDKARLAALQQNAQASAAQVADAKQALAAAQQDRQVIAATVDNLKKKRSDYQAALGDNAGASPQQIQAFQDQMAQLNSNIAQCESQLNTLDQAMSVSRVG